MNLSRVSRLVPTLALVAGASSAPAMAQIKSMDVRNKLRIHYEVDGIGHFNARSMNIPFSLVNSGSYDDYVSKSMANLGNMYVNNSDTYQSYAQQVTGLTGTAANLAFASLWEGFTLVVNFFQQENNAFNSYTFYTPAPATYQVSAHLTGGIDKPRNRVTLQGPEGTNQLDDDNPSSSCDKTYTVQLQKGIHTLTVALGSGSSALFHNAGSLNWVAMRNPSYVSWTDNVAVVQGNSQPYYDNPTVGATWSKVFTAKLPVDQDFTNITDGTAYVDSLVSVGTITDPITYMLSVNVKNCLGNTVELPTNYTNAHATMTTTPDFAVSGGYVSLYMTSKRLSDTVDFGDYEVCASTAPMP